jgi:hypothetical protein
MQCDQTRFSAAANPVAAAAISHCSTVIHSPGICAEHSATEHATPMIGSDP